MHVFLNTSSIQKLNAVSESILGDYVLSPLELPMPNI